MDAAAMASRSDGRTEERPSPLARGLVWRLSWALGLAALLWAGVFWALA